jgi:transcriptional regulator with XRE-family HTH domain
MGTLQQRVEEAVAAGFSLADLARAAGVDSAAVSHWHKGRTKSLKAKSALGLAEFTGRSASWWAEGKTAASGDWRLLQHAPKGVVMEPVAQYLSHPQSEDEPQLHTWEFILSAVILPARFRLAVPDDALAPSTPKGTVLIFEPAAPPVFGHGVLVEDAAGVRYVRKYAQGPGGRWLAVANNPAYLTLDSADGARVLAAVTWRATGEV